MTSVRRIVAGSLGLALLLVAGPPLVHAGGQGSNLPPVPLPVRGTELRVGAEARMVCVADPTTVCTAPYLDVPIGATNTDGGTFRSAACPGVPNGACRPDYIVGAELTGELIVDWPITRLPNAACGSSPAYEICQDGHIELNVTGPGVTVANPIAEFDDGPGQKCECIDDPSLDSIFNGEKIEAWWQTRNVGATCDVALEYAHSLVPRGRIVAIGQQAFPSMLCYPDASGTCTIRPVPVFVEPDGSLTKGCGFAPSNTFTIRFARSNEVIAFVRKSLPTSPREIADADGDGFADLFDNTLTTVGVNQGNNLFSDQASGLAGSTLASAAVSDWTGDGNPDLVGRVASTDIRVFPGDGAGVFSDPGSFTIDTVFSGLLRGEDLNADTRPDLVSNSGSDSRIVWNQTGAPVSPAVDAPPGLSTRSVVDTDADSDLDLLGTASVPFVGTDVKWASNGGPGTFPVQTLVSVARETDQLVPLLGQDTVDLLQCDEYASDCCTPNGTAGCDDLACEDIVCNSNFEDDCCNFAWDDNCSSIALERCGVCMPAGTTDCCFEHGTTGCGVTSCEDIVCEFDPFCCSGNWDDTCADLARGWCPDCHFYGAVCTATVGDVDGSDVDGDGDTDICAAILVDLDLQHTTEPNAADREAGYFVCLPNQQVDDPGSSGGQPLFDTGVAPWQLLGPATARDGTVSPIELTDLDGDTDPDAVGVGFWYQNQGGGSFSGPHRMGIGAASQGCGIDGLVGYWRFSGDANDTTTCGHDGVVTGASLTSDLDGTANSAYLFDGVDDYIDLGTSSVLQPPLPVTISAYLRNDCPAATNCWIFENDAYPTSYVGVSFAISDNGLYAQYGDGNGASSLSRRSATTSALLTAGVWYHVAVVIRGAFDFRFYIDGVRVDPGQVALSGTGGAMVYFGNNARIGLDGGVFNAHFEGDLDEIRFYDRALSEEEIQALSAPGDPLSPPTADPSESLDLSQLRVLDLETDSDADVVGNDLLWQAVPEPGRMLMLGSGLALLRVLALRRARRAAR